MPVSFGGHNLPPLVEIGLTDLPKSEVAMAQACHITTVSYISAIQKFNLFFKNDYETSQDDGN